MGVRREKHMIRKIVEINEDLCNGCELCVTACHEGAIEMIDGKAKLVSDIYCDGLGDCLPACPTGAIEIIERTAVEYSQNAVDERLAAQKKALEAVEEKKVNETVEIKTLPVTDCGCDGAHDEMKKSLPVHDCGCGGAHDEMMKKMQSGGGCPGSAAMKLNVVSGQNVTNKAQAQAKVAGMKERLSEDPVKAELQSKLSSWPVQLNLVNPQADYLEGADLLIAADCTPFAYANFHNDFIKGRVTLIGCPKLDDNDYYIEKIGMILKQNNINSITVVRMEVPCCSGIVGAVKQAMLNSGMIVNYNEVTIGLDGSKS